MALKSKTRYIELIDDINNHVFQWAADEDWRKLPPKVNVALTTLMNELKIAQAIKESGGKDIDMDNAKADKWGFIALFKKKYLTYTNFEFRDKITPLHQCNIDRAIQTIKEEGGNYVEFLEWFFDDFLSVEENKKNPFYCPPALNTVCSNNIVNKYLFVMKDTLRIRKSNISKENVRTLLLDVALSLGKRIDDPDFRKKIVDYDNQLMTPTKFLSLMQVFAKKHDDKEGIEACEKLVEQIENAKKSGNAS